MSLTAWVAFALASFVIGVVPGPGVLSIVGYAVGGGRRVALASVAGIALGNAVAMTLSFVGVGALLAASAAAFAFVRWAGALYLVGLGAAVLLRSRRGAAAAGAAHPPASPRTAFLSNVLVGTFHPKTIVFFAAFVPQFVSPGAPYAPQGALLIVTFCGVVGFTDTLYALLASRAARVLRRPGATLWMRRAGGGALIAAGVATAATR